MSAFVFIHSLSLVSQSVVSSVENFVGLLCACVRFFCCCFFFNFACYLPLFKSNCCLLTTFFGLSFKFERTCIQFLLIYDNMF